MLVLSQYVEEGYALDLLQETAEGVGYLLKDRVYDLDEFVAAIKRVAAGGCALIPPLSLSSSAAAATAPSSD